jgi:hypothetical protein
VRGDLTEQRFSDDDLRRIFAEAAQSEVHGRVPGGGRHGLGLDDLRAIAQEVGIEPAAVDRAAANLVAARGEQGRTPRTAASFSFSRLVHEDALIPRSLTSDEMRAVTSQVELVLGRRGRLHEAGDWVEWRDTEDRLYVGMVRGASQTRIRAIADHTRELLLGSSVIGVFGVAALVAALDLPQGRALAAALLVGAGTYGLFRVFWNWRSSIARRHLAELLEILEDTVRR